MNQEKLDLTWHQHATYFQNIIAQLYISEELSDVTLVCDDQVKFKVHKFVLRACSPVFESILEDMEESKSIVYLRGVSEVDLRPILEFIYFGQASFYHDRIQNFIRIGKDLQIREIKDVCDPTDLKNVTESGEHKEEMNHENDISDYVPPPNNKVQQCPNCDASFTHKSSMLRHIKTVHEVSDDIPIMSKVKCPDCDASFINRSGMLRHMRSVHGEKKFSCDQCNFVASRNDVLLRHVRHAHVVKFNSEDIIG